MNSFVNEIEEGMEMSGQDGLDRLGLVSTLVSTECLNLKRIGHFKRGYILFITKFIGSSPNFNDASPNIEI